MELEEMKNLWKGMSAQVEKQELLTKNLIEKVTEQKYYSKLNKIRYSEIIGTIICYLGAIYLIMNFMKIDPLAEKNLCGYCHWFTPNITDNLFKQFERNAESKNIFKNLSRHFK